MIHSATEPAVLYEMQIKLLTNRLRDNRTAFFKSTKEVARAAIPQNFPNGEEKERRTAALAKLFCRIASGKIQFTHPLDCLIEVFIESVDDIVSAPLVNAHFLVNRGILVGDAHGVRRVVATCVPCDKCIADQALFQFLRARGVHTGDQHDPEEANKLYQKTLNAISKIAVTLNKLEDIDFIYYVELLAAEGLLQTGYQIASKRQESLRTFSGSFLKRCAKVQMKFPTDRRAYLLAEAEGGNGQTEISRDWLVEAIEKNPSLAEFEKPAFGDTLNGEAPTVSKWLKPTIELIEVTHAELLREARQKAKEMDLKK